MARSASVPNHRRARTSSHAPGSSRSSSGRAWHPAPSPPVAPSSRYHTRHRPAEAPLGFGAPGRLESSDVVVLFRTVPSPIEIGQHFTVEALVCPTPPIGAAAGFMVDARMPEHRHGMNYRARVFRKPDGIYVAEGLLFHMPGLWQLMFDVERGDRMERLTTDLDLE